MHPVTLLLFTGGWGESDVEQALRGAHGAAARDLLETLISVQAIDRVIVATDDSDWAGGLADLPITVDVDSPGSGFHFGRRLADLIKRFDVRRALYTGGGSAPLLSAEQWAEVGDRLSTSDRLVVTNNLHSCDWAGFSSAAEAAKRLSGQANDNSIAWLLANEGRFDVHALEPSAASRFDIDTPADLLIARTHPEVGSHLRRYLLQLGWNSPQLEEVQAEMGREGGRLAIVGRCSPTAWRALQDATRCWVRVFAEERGMRASGRQARGEVRSLLSYYLDQVGFDRFYATLGELANGILLDNRVLLASRGIWPSPSDRFNADLYRWERIENPFLRKLTRAAARAKVSVVMGGHTVVAGGLMALAESTQLRHGRARQGGGS